MVAEGGFLLLTIFRICGIINVENKKVGGKYGRYKGI